MDAHDIFKKITRGAKFSKRKKPPGEFRIPDVSIKEEAPDGGDESAGGELGLSVESTGAEGDLTLLGDLRTSERRSRKRKRAKYIDDAKRNMLEQEEINRYRNQNKISVVGRHVAEPVRSFADLNVDCDLVGNIRKCGYLEPTPVQKQVLPIMLQRRQVLVCAPTGSGKTAAFLLPIIHELQGPRRLGFRALIICPTRELAKQTQRECVRLSEGRGFKIHVLSKIKKALTQYGSKSSQKFDILITTPNRLCFLLKQDPPAVSLCNVNWLVVDEADKLFEEGGAHNFMEQLNDIFNACTSKDKHISMFSATYTPKVAKWCVHNMKGLIRVTIGQRNAAADTVDQELLFVGSEEGKLLAFRDLVRKGVTPPVLVFVQSKERAQQLFNELLYDGINVDAIHADRTQVQRDNTVRSFREGRIWFLICTELMARGIDFKGVNLVINYDFPSSAISYVHRIGRAGRAGRKGKAITFFTIDDTVNLRSIAHVLKQSGQEVPAFMLAMKKHSNKEKRQLKVSAPKRKAISTTPVYELKKRAKWKNKKKVAEEKSDTIKSDGRK